MERELKKAILPVGGLGTRFLPATKASPKEMLPVVDKPLIQYAVEEAVNAGFKEIIFVTSNNKRAIEDHFDRNVELEYFLDRNKKLDLLASIRDILPKDVSCSYTRQSQPLGLGHAVLCAKNMVGDEPFAVLLADDLIDAKPGCLKQMVDQYKEVKASIVSVMPIHNHTISQYGVIDPVSETNDSALIKCKGLVEKPKAADAPSHYGVVGRYILTPAIFQLLEKTQKDHSGEIQLTAAICALLKTENVYGYEFQGQRFDCGNKLGYLKAMVHFAKKHPEIGKDFSAYLKEQAVLENPR